jgi:hypothetical protein
MPRRRIPVPPAWLTFIGTLFFILAVYTTKNTEGYAERGSLSPIGARAFAKRSIVIDAQ